jgi:CheY-like chemotaxis protein
MSVMRSRSTASLARTCRLWSIGLKMTRNFNRAFEPHPRLALMGDEPFVPMDQQRLERPKRVLVADDDVAVCELLHVVLTPLADVTVVNDAESALEVLASQPPFDAIVSDFMLPGISGIEFVQRVRSDERDARIPILVISGHGSAVGDSAREAGADAFLDKPFTLDDLRAMVRSLLFPPVQFA